MTTIKAIRNMHRPTKKRNICLNIKTTCFNPGLNISDINGSNFVIIEVDELEALRLADLEGYYQEAAAEKMGVSRATFGNIINQGHKKVADALINGKAICINCPKLRKKAVNDRK